MIARLRFVKLSTIWAVNGGISGGPLAVVITLQFQNTHTHDGQLPTFNWGEVLGDSANKSMWLEHRNKKHTQALVVYGPSTWAKYWRIRMPLYPHTHVLPPLVRPLKSFKLDSKAL